jgi:hypothetical protein
MTAIYSSAVKTARMTAVRDAIDAGGAAGRLEIGTSGMGTVLATITLGYSGASTGTVSGDVLTLAGFPRQDSSADASGTAAAARIRTSAGVDVVTGLTVGVGSGDIQIDSLIVTAAQTFQLTSVTITHAA